MKRIVLSLLLAASGFAMNAADVQAQTTYKMAGPYEVVARDGEHRATKGGSERDMHTAWDCARTGETDKALEIINAYAKTLQRFDGHDAPLCTIQAYWLVRAMTEAKAHQRPEWTAMIRRAILPLMEQFEADSPYANGNWGAIVNRCRMACAIFLEDSLRHLPGRQRALPGRHRLPPQRQRQRCPAPLHRPDGTVSGDGARPGARAAGTRSAV